MEACFPSSPFSSSGSLQKWKKFSPMEPSAEKLTLSEAGSSYPEGTLLMPGYGRESGLPKRNMHTSVSQHNKTICFQISYGVFLPLPKFPFLRNRQNQHLSEMGRATNALRQSALPHMRASLMPALPPLRQRRILYRSFRPLFYRY